MNPSNSAVQMDRVSKGYFDSYGKSMTGSGTHKGRSLSMNSQDCSAVQRTPKLQRSFSLNHLEEREAIRQVIMSGLLECYQKPVEGILKCSHLERALIEQAHGEHCRTVQQMNVSEIFDHYRRLNSQDLNCNGEKNATEGLESQELTLLDSSNCVLEESECHLIRVLRLQPNQRGEVEVCNTTQRDLDCGLWLPPAASIIERDESGLIPDFRLRKPCKHYTEKSWLENWNPIQIVRPQEKVKITTTNNFKYPIDLLLHVNGSVEGITWVEKHVDGTDEVICARLKNLKVINENIVDDVGCQTDVDQVDFSEQCTMSCCDVGCQTEDPDRYNDQGDICPSHAHTDATWRTVVKDGVKHCYLTTDTCLKPAYAGPSSRYSMYVDGYDENDRRAYKVISFINEEDSGVDVKYIDYELFWHLRRTVLFLPFTDKTLQNLRIESVKFFALFKTNHLDMALVTHVTEATCLAAAVPPRISLKRARAILNWNAARLNRKYKELVADGKVSISWWQFWRKEEKLFDKTE